MKTVKTIRLKENSKEEVLPDFSPDFPYIASCALLDQYCGMGAPWHWHRSVELFYVESGTLEYMTPNGRQVFPAGTGGFLNSNVLHASRVIPSDEKSVQLLHLFEPEFLSGGQNNRLYRKYIRPLTMASDVVLIALSPEQLQHAELLKKIRDAFALEEEHWGFEFLLRSRLAEIWLSLYELVRPTIEQRAQAKEQDVKLKTMLQYIHTHYAEPICVKQLAAEAYASNRDCFRMFQKTLHMTPVEYIRRYRLQKACRQLAETKNSVTGIACDCGFGTCSYFGKIFREYFSCTPTEYRRKWRDSDIIWHEQDSMLSK